MDPRAPEILSRLCGLADAMIRAQDDGLLRPDDRRAVELGQVYGELTVMFQARPDCGFDDTALELARCLIHLDENAAPFGDSELATKWAKIAGAILKFVRTDLAAAIDAVVRPATSDHDHQRSR